MKEPMDFELMARAALVIARGTDQPLDITLNNLMRSHREELVRELDKVLHIDAAGDPMFLIRHLQDRIQALTHIKEEENG